MRNLLVGMFMLLTAVSANAVNLAFKFEVNSSGNSMYACNAGLKKVQATDRVCYDRAKLDQGELTSCTPNVACSTGDNCNCVCTGGGLGNTAISNEGNSRLDFYRASVANWTDNGEVATGITSVYKEAGDSSFNSIYALSEMFGKQLTSLEFNFGSERYGTEYFVDICFRATQIEYDYNSSLNWTIKGGVTVTDLGDLDNDDFTYDGALNEVLSGETYQSLAGLEVKGSVFCKDKAGTTVNLGTFSGYDSFTAGQLKTLISTSTGSDLKGCYFRYSFKESNTAGITSIRKWKKQKAKVCTYSSVNEPLN